MRFEQLLLPVGLLLLAVGCGATDMEVSTRDDGAGGIREVTMPEDPFFTEFAYPEAVATASQTTAETSIVWFSTSDDLAKVNAFYKEKFSDGELGEQSERSSYVLRADGGARRGVNVLKEADGKVQVILRLDRPR